MGPLRLGYATYAMKDQDIFDAFPRLREIGYETVEITVSEGYPTSYDRLDADDRARLRSLLRDLEFTTPALMDLVAPCSRGAEREAMLKRFDESCRLCRDLHYGDERAVVKSPITGEQPPWEGNRKSIRDDLLELADVAAEHDVVFATEAHVGTALDTPDKVEWLMETTDHPHLGINFDISHFPTELFDTDRAIEACIPYAVHTHVKDSVIIDDETRFRIPGATDFDYEEFLEKIVAAGYRGDIIAEVSAQLWREPDFDPWAAAEASYANLSGPVSAVNERFRSTGASG